MGKEPCIPSCTRVASYLFVVPGVVSERTHSITFFGTGNLGWWARSCPRRMYTRCDDCEASVTKVGRLSHDWRAKESRNRKGVLSPRGSSLPQWMNKRSDGAIPVVPQSEFLEAGDHVEPNVRRDGINHQVPFSYNLFLFFCRIYHGPFPILLSVTPPWRSRHVEAASRSLPCSSSTKPRPIA